MVNKGNFKITYLKIKMTTDAKEDILGIRQLDKFTDIIRLIKKSGKAILNIVL